MKRIVLGIVAMAGVAAAALPASAQTWGWGGGDYNSGWNRGWNGGWGGRYAFAGYPEFRGEQDHIRQEIHEGLEEGWLDRDEAGDLNRQLRHVQQEQAGEFREHGWNLPDGDRARIRADLHEIDEAVDAARDGQ